jgi:hypothetical protein
LEIFLGIGESDARIMGSDEIGSRSPLREKREEDAYHPELLY